MYSIRFEVFNASDMIMHEKTCMIISYRSKLNYFKEFESSVRYINPRLLSIIQTKAIDAKPSGTV